MKQDKQDIAYRQYLKDEKRMREIDALLREIPLVPLETPFQQGWIISIRLRDDISRRKDANEILELIRIGYKKELITNSEKEIKMIRNGKKSYTYTRNKERFTKSFIPERRKLDEKTYNSLSEQFKSYFYEDTFDYGFKKYGYKVYYLDIPSYWITLKARPNMITHQRVKGGELEKEYAFLSDRSREYWLSHKGWGKMFDNDIGGKRTKARIAIRKFIKGESEDIDLEKIRSINHY